MRKKQHTPWMLIPTLRLIGFMVNCLNSVIQLRNYLLPQRSRPTTIRLLKPITTTKSSELNFDEPIEVSGVSSTQYLVAHHNHHSLSLQVHDTSLNRKWIYRFDNMSEYTDCLCQHLSRAIPYDKAPDFFISADSGGPRDRRRTRTIR